MADLTEKEKKWLGCNVFPVYSYIYEWDYRIWLKRIDERLKEWEQRTGKTIPGLGKVACDEPTHDYPNETELETLRRLRVKVADLAAKIQLKAILLHYEFRDGEHEYIGRRLLVLEDGETPKQVIHNYLKDMWGEGTKFEDDSYWSPDETVAVSEQGWDEVELEHIPILQRYGL